MTPELAFNTVGQLRDEHELAELLRRDRREPPHPGRHARRPQLHLGRDGPRRRHRPGPRPHAGAAPTTIGNYWVDLTRGVLYILLPISIVGALVLVWQGVPQTLDGPHDGHDARRARSRPSPRARSRPRRSIKELGNNGGGFLNANSAHPFENPTPLTNWLEMFAILVDPVRADLHLRPLRRRTSARAGRSSPRWPRILLVGAVVAMSGEFVGNPLFPAGVDQAGSATWRARRSASAPPLGGLFGPRSRPAPARAPSTPARQPPADRAASSRCSTCSSARSPRAASAPACTGCSSSARSSRSSSPA